MPTVTDFSTFLRSFNSEKFRNLWDAQRYILNKYREGYESNKDIAIELPTGAGKTLIALLIAEAWRQNGKKVAILSANKTLARQMNREAELLRIPAILMEGRGIDIPSRDKRSYHRANKIALMNYWVYFNQNPVLDNADLLIMDDAHLAEHCFHSLWSVEIDRYIHESLFKALVTELLTNFPEYTVLQDALDDNPTVNTPPELLSFIDQVAIAPRLKEIIDTSPLLETNADLNFRWNRIRNKMNDVNIYLSLNSIWIRPYVYPLSSLSHYSDVEQRIYMSATIGETSDLCRRLGARKIEKIPVIAEFAESTSGRRFIVINRIEEKDIPVRLQRAILAALATHPKSVWICNSRADAEKLRQTVAEWLNASGFVGQNNWLLSSLGDEIDQFKQAAAGHLFVGGRFDGMDFHGDECRLVVLATLPKAINLQEEFLSAYLRDSGFMKRRLNQRIIQALGRCNREEDDYAVYVLADRRFATHFGRESNRQGITKNLVAEIDMAEEMAEIEIDALTEKVSTFLSSQFTAYDTEFEHMLGEIPPGEEMNDLSELAEDEVLGWTAMFASQNYNIASQKFENCWNIALRENLIELGAFYGWCWAKARYLESIQGELSSREDALSILDRAISRGGRSSWFNRMKTSLNRARHQTISPDISSEEYSLVLIRTFDGILEESGARGNRFERWCNNLETRLTSQSHNEYQSGFLELGKILGYDSLNPRHGASTDCRWRGIFGNSKEMLTFELKIEDVPSGKISASDIGQVHNQITRALSEYDRFGYIVRGVVVTHLEELYPDAESSAGEIRIIPKDVIFSLWSHVKSLLTSYRTTWSLDDINVRKQAADLLTPRIPESGWLVRALNVDSRFVTRDNFLNEWVE